MEKTNIYTLEEISQGCRECGCEFKEAGADASTAYFRCKGAGHLAKVKLENGDNMYMAIKRRDLIGKIREGFEDWRVTRWDSLHKELIDFCNLYDEAQTDIQIQMGILACMTKGFNTIDAEKYPQCKRLFKITERMYKQRLKELKRQMDKSLPESFGDYKNDRVQYMKCRDEYRSMKLAWKIVLYIVKKLLPFLKFW